MPVGNLRTSGDLPVASVVHASGQLAIHVGWLDTDNACVGRQRARWIKVE